MARKLNLSLPGNPRYQPKKLTPMFGYDNLYQTAIDVVLATLATLAEIGIVPADDYAQLTDLKIKKIREITTTRVDAVERTVTKHDVRALIRIMQSIVGRQIGRWLHIPNTSYDVLHTALTLQFLRAHREALKPTINEVVLIFIDLVRKCANDPQIGRTHRQHALPITVGFWLATILERICYNAQKMDLHAGELVGKISGAVGAYNAQEGLGISKRCGERTFEERVLGKLGLKPARISTQILPPEPLAYYLFSCLMLSGALGQFGRDGRNLMSSEIGELTKIPELGSSGSSTMIKVNPIELEGVEGAWLKNDREFGKVGSCVISEFQRDLVGSSLMRDFATLIVNLQYQLDTLLRKDKHGRPFLRRVDINRDHCAANLQLNSHTILGEPLHIALQLHGYPKDPYKLVNDELAPIARQKKIPLIDVAIQRAETGDRVLKRALANMSGDIIDLLKNPFRYTGRAQQKALEIADLAERQFKTAG